MSLRITIVPASTKAGRETIRQLLEFKEKSLTIRGIYRDTSKVPSEFTQHANFEATEGDVGTASGLDFSSSDAVFYIPPPTYDGTDQGEWATQSAKNVKSAILGAPSVKRLLIFSAVGSQHDHGIVRIISSKIRSRVSRLTGREFQGILRQNHITYTILKDAVPEVVVVRPGYFQEEFAHALEMAQADPPVLYSWITPVEHKIPIVSSTLVYSPNLVAGHTEHTSR
jgi:hypothetical protein